MSTDAGNAAAPEDAATREAASARPGTESADPGSAASATSTPETADRGVGGAVDTDRDTGGDEGDRDDAGAVEPAGSGGTGDDSGGFLGGLIRDSTVTGLPGETGAPPAEPHAPQAQQEGDEPVGSEPQVGDNPRGVD